MSATSAAPRSLLPQPVPASTLPAVVEGQLAHVTTRVNGGMGTGGEASDEVAFIEWDGTWGRAGGAWGRVAVVMASGCAAVVDVAPDAPAAVGHDS